MKKIMFTLFAALASAASLNAALPSAQERVGTLCGMTEARVWESPKGGSLPFRLYVPQDAGKKIPLVLFLHGAGERGTNNTSQLVHCAYELMQYAKDAEPFVAVFPQCPAGSKWAGLDWSKQGHVMQRQTDQVRMVFEILDDVAKTLPMVDRDRTYVCGISMGGYGTFDVLCRDPGRFAAGIVCCGGADANAAAKALKDKPVWIVHSDDDGAVPFTNSVQVADALKACGNRQFRFTPLHGYGHNVWTWTFGNREILDWMFAQKSVRRDVCCNDRYARENKSVEPGKIVLFGDSITDFWPRGGRKAFFDRYGLVGRGISGQTTVDMLGRFRQDVVSLGPKAVVILAGTNDMAENRGPSSPELAASNIASMCDIAKANGIRPYVCSVTPVAQYQWRKSINDAPYRVRRLNALLKAWCEKSGTDYIDYYSELVDGNGGMGANANDGVHPNDKGYDTMQRVLVKSLGL